MMKDCPRFSHEMEVQHDDTWQGHSFSGRQEESISTLLHLFGSPKTKELSIHHKLQCYRGNGQLAPELLSSYTCVSSLIKMIAALHLIHPHHT